MGRRIQGPSDAVALFAVMAHLDHEELHAAYLTAQHVVIAVETIAIGGLCSVDVTPAQILRPALRHNAAAAIVAHCHPSGDPTPSTSDKLLTRRLIEVGAELGVRILDHIVVGHGRAFSLTEKRELDAIP